MVGGPFVFLFFMCNGYLPVGNRQAEMAEALNGASRNPIQLWGQGADKQGGASALKGRISMGRGTTPRSIDVSLECTAVRPDGSRLGPPAITIYSISMS